MGISEDLESKVQEIFRSSWKDRDGQKVPEPEDLTLGNEAVKLEGTVLYADLAESTYLVDHGSKEFAAEVYKTYLHCASTLIRNAGGVITAYDGDRVMGVFIGGSKNTSAVKCALNINYAVTKIINPAIKNQYAGSTYEVRHAVGIDTSNLYVARTGVRGSNDLVWVGRSANYAAKLCSLREGGYASWITEQIYNNMNDEAKYGPNNVNMWEWRNWSAYNVTVYRSSWYWKPS